MTTAAERDRVSLRRRMETLRLPVAAFHRHGFVMPTHPTATMRQPEAVGVGSDGSALALWQYCDSARRKQVTWHVGGRRRVIGAVNVETDLRVTVRLPQRGAGRPRRPAAVAAPAAVVPTAWCRVVATVATTCVDPRRAGPGPPHAVCSRRHPSGLARRQRPVTFVDVVYRAATFTDLFDLIRTWIDDDCQPWPTIRRKLRFVGVTSRTKTSPNTYRWQQHAAWTRQLPARAVLNVSLHPQVWSYFGDYQIKLTRALRPERWLAIGDGPSRDERTRHALAEAAAVVAYGRSPAGRQALARATRREPALAQPWLRTLVTSLNSGS